MADEKQIIEARHTRVGLPVGDFDHSEWNKAQPIYLTRYWSGEEALTGRHAEARMLWSSKALHVRFICNQAEPLFVSSNPQTSKKTMNLWDRDVCEIFIAPDANMPARYLEYEAAPTGEWLDVGVDW